MTENEFLEYMRGRAAELKRGPEVLKKHKPKIVRMESGRMKVVGKATKNTFRASYQDAETAAKGCVVGEPEVTTREVGPGDKYNRAEDYRVGTSGDQ